MTEPEDPEPVSEGSEGGTQPNGGISPNAIEDLWHTAEAGSLSCGTRTDAGSC